MSKEQQTITKDDPRLLPHDSIHPECEQTILLLYGAFTSKKTWSCVHDQLPQYHLLIPTGPTLSLPNHDSSIPRRGH